MKHIRLALLIATPLALCALRAQEERQAPPTEIPDFSNIDEYVYEPKSILHLGVRRLSGAKTSFAGQGKLLAPEASSPATGVPSEGRSYHDGQVGADSRTVVADNGDGGNIFVPISPDGRTNSWGFADNRQLTSDGFINFHTYSAEITDTATREKKAASAFGMEVSVATDMGKIRQSRLSWSLFAGVSLNDINTSLSDKVRANITTMTDTYDLFGQTPPTGPYSAPSSTSVTVDNGDGTSGTISVDTTTLLGNQPLLRTVAVTTDSASVTNRWKLRGAYFTFRAGPTISWPLTAKLRATLSAGAAIAYAGSTYSVEESFQPESGAPILDSLEEATSRGLAGYFVDASLEYDITERTGLYVGATYQSTGSYDQTVTTPSASYSTTVDLSKQNGVTAGMTYRF